MNAEGTYELEWTLGAERVYGCSDDEYRRRGWRSFVIGDGWEERVESARSVICSAIPWSSAPDPSRDVRCAG